MSQYPPAPDFRAKQQVFDEIIALLVANQLSLSDLQAYVDAAEVMQSYMKVAKEYDPQKLEECFRSKCLEIAERSGIYVDSRVQWMGEALDSLTRR